MSDGNFDFHFKPPQIKLKPKVVATFVVVIIAVIIAATTFYMVDQTEKAVVLRFGEFNRITEPGLHVMLPFGIEKNYNVQTEVIQLMAFDFKSGNAPRTRGGNTGESTMLTGDLNIVNVEWIIQYKISDPRAWLFNVEHKETTIWDISQSIINMLVGDRGIFHVIGQDRAAIESSCTDLLNAKFKDYNFGIDVTTVRLQSVVAPAGAVQDAFEDVNKAQQDMNRLINEGKEAYNKEIPRARGDAERLIQEAKGYAAERENMATGDVARFNSVYNEYRNNRNVTRTRLYIEMIEDVFKEKENTDLIDKNLKNFVPFKGLQNEGGAR